MPRDTPPVPGADQAGDFPDARAVHEEILATPEQFPAGWVEQARFREDNDLPPFRPPRFADGTRIRPIVGGCEDRFDVRISFVSYGADEGWTVEVDGAPAFGIERYRDDAANTVVDVPAETFRDRIAAVIDA